MVEQLNTIARLWWDWSVAMFWQVGLLILVIAAIDRLTRRWAWPQLRYALWSLILVKLLLPPSLSLPSGVVPGLAPVVRQALVRLESEKPVAAESRTLFFLNEDVLPACNVPARASRSTGILPVRGPQTHDSAFGGPSSMGVPPMNRTLTHGQDARATHGRDAHATETPYGVTTNGPLSSMPEAQSSVSIAWQVYAMAASLAGTLILGIWLVLRLRSFVGPNAQIAAAASLPQSFYNQLAGCARRLELGCIPRVVVTKRLATPAVFGMFRPVLLMPKGYLGKLSRRDTEHMLLHELAHIKRGDLVAHGLYMLFQVVYWYNPLLWLVRRQMHHLRELSCDATVAEVLREQTAAYRQTLLETARRLLTSSVEPGLGLLGLFEDSNRLLVRLNWLTKPTWRYRTMKRVTVATIAALMFACVLPMARAQEAASNDQSPEVVQHSNQASQEIALLQARLNELMAQQQDLRKQLDALRQGQQQSGPSNVKLKREVSKRPSGEPFNMHVVEKGDTLASIAEKFYGPELGSRPENIDRIVEENHLGKSDRLMTGQSLRIPVRWIMTEDETADPAHEQGDVTIVPWQDRKPTEEELRVLSEARKEAAIAQQEQARAMVEMKRAQMEALRAQLEAERAAVAGDKAKDKAKPEKEWAEQIQKYQADVEKWQNSDEMKQWQQQVQQWGQELGRLYQQANGEGSTGVVPPMPPMPPMPAMPQMHAMSADMYAGPAREERMPDEVPVPKPQPVPHVTVPHATIPHVQVPALPAVPETPKEPEHVVPCGEFVVKSFPAEGALLVENRVGSVAVAGAEGGTCTVVATARIKGVEREEAERIAAKILVHVTPADGRVRVRTQLPEDMSQEQRDQISIDLKIAVPSGAKVQVAQKVGNASLSSLSGQVAASVDVGSIKTRDLQGDVVLRTNVGNIQFTTSRDLSATVRAQAQIGSISSNLPLEITSASAMQAGNAQNALGSHATGTLGDGRNKIELITNVGSIEIHWKEAPQKREVF